MRRGSPSRLLKKVEMLGARRAKEEAYWKYAARLSDPSNDADRPFSATLYVADEVREGRSDPVDRST
jgi:hypothetical protein